MPTPEEINQQLDDLVEQLGETPNGRRQLLDSLAKLLKANRGIIIGPNSKARMQRILDLAEQDGYDTQGLRFLFSTYPPP